MRQAILEKVRSSQKASRAGVPVRFITEFGAPKQPVDVAALIRESLHLEARVTPLSQAHGEAAVPKDDALARFLVIEVPGASLAQLQPSPFEFGYALGEVTAAITVEPELGVDFFSDDGGSAESVDNFPPGCWVDDNLDPSGAAPLWAVKKIGAPAAWVLTPPPGGKCKGEGVSVFQPDTGVANHTELAGGMIDQSRAHDFVDNRTGAVDPMNYAGNPGHGTGTSSVVAGRGASGKMSGSAPGALVVPLRAVTAVVVFDHGRVAAAVEHARRNGADVITMSLGGAWSSALRAAINAAIKDGVIVLAAAGNCVSVVVFPARYEEVVAVAGVNKDDNPWIGTCSGRAVDISAPGEFVPRANAAPSNGGSPTNVRGGQGTSFAVALTAGVAALWLAYHGKDAIRASLRPGETIQDKFVSLLKATAHKPDKWDSTEYGAGVVNAERLLKAPLSIGVGETEAVASGQSVDELHSVRTLLEETFSGTEEAAAASVDAEPVERRFAAELTHLALMKRKSATRGETESVDSVIVPSETLERARRNRFR